MVAGRTRIGEASCCWAADPGRKPNFVVAQQPSKSSAVHDAGRKGIWGTLRLPPGSVLTVEPMKHTGHIRSGALSSGSGQQRPLGNCLPAVAGDQPRARLNLAPALQACGGLLIYGASLLGLPLSTAHIAQFEALNRELGKLCTKPPQEALTEIGRAHV